MGVKLSEKFQKKIIDWLMREPPPREFPLSNYERICYEIRPCDVILVEGMSRVSEIIKITTSSPWSHAALYIGRLHDIRDPVLRDRVRQHYEGSLDEQLIIESQLGQGTIVVPLSTYKDAHIRICRPKGISQTDASKVVAYAVSRLGSQYGIRHILDLLRLMFPWSFLPRRFRSSLFEKRIGAPIKEICSSMIADAFREVHFPILPFAKTHKKKGLQLYHRNPRLYTPSDFDYSPYFEIIKYPFFEIEQHTVYRNLPWNKELVSSVDEIPTHSDEDDDESDKPANGATNQLAS